MLQDGTTDLKQSLCEGSDFVFFPETLYLAFESLFGGGPAIARKVITIGAQYLRRTQVELYPVKVEVYMERVLSTIGDDSLSKLTPEHILNLSRTCSIQQAFTAVCKSVHKDEAECRLWIQIGGADDDYGSGGSNVSKGRKCTVDLTDRVGSWQYVRNMSVPNTLADLSMQTIQVMVEFQAVDNSGVMYWPKDDALNDWKSHLRVGDWIDAQDDCGDWYEAEVLAIDQLEKTLRVHFKGWGHKFDVTIAEKDLDSKVAPLYSITDNWRDALEPFDKVDYTDRLNLKDGSKWLHAYVMKVDHAKGLVTVKYRDENFQIYESLEWLDINGESICKAGTHVKTAAPNFAHSIGTRVGYSNSSGGDYNYSGAYNSSREPTSSAYSSSAYSSSTYSYGGYSTYPSRHGHTPGTPPVNGAVGLCNLGNTCFMASMLQCLSNTKRLTDVFLADQHVPQLNKDNPLGHGGKVAISYAKLMKDMWSGRYTSVAPVDFKQTIGEFRPQFAGFQQQDSQEFMLFLLDGLHEDMNRIRSKPTTEKIESNGRDDELIARESWRRFLLRNDSELVDCCFGQLRSHVTCSNCRYQSVTFDAFSSLSLPLPVKNTVLVEVVVYPLPHGSPPLKLSFDVDVTSSIQDVKNLIHDRLHKRAPDKKRARHGVETAGSSDYVVVGKGVGDSTSSTGSDADGVKVDNDDLLDDLEDLGVVNPENIDVVGEDVEEDGVVISSAAAPSRGVKNSPHSPQEPEEEGGYYHICQVGKGRNPRIFKTFADSAGARDLKKSTYENVVAFELTHDVPILSYHSYDQPKSPYAYVDVLMGCEVKSRYTTYAQTNFDTIGPPQRFSYAKDTTTNGDIHMFAWKIMRGYLHEDSPYRNYSPLTDPAHKCPYEIHHTSAMGSSSRGVFSRDMDQVLSLSPYDSLICVWKDDARDLEHFDESAVERLQIRDEKPRASGYNSDSDDDKNPSGRTKGSVHVLQCLDKFIEREQMPPLEEWYCPKCKQHNAPLKKFDLWSAPDVLIIHLKRFQYTGGTFPMRDKISDHVEFPIENLDLRDYVKSPSSNCDEVQPVYDLYAVSEHMGGMGGGHYTATVQNPLNKKWLGDVWCMPPIHTRIDGSVLLYFVLCWHWPTLTSMTANTALNINDTLCLYSDIHFLVCYLFSVSCALVGLGMRSMTVRSTKLLRRRPSRRWHMCSSTRGGEAICSLLYSLLLY